MIKDVVNTLMFSRIKLVYNKDTIMSTLALNNSIMLLKHFMNKWKQFIVIQSLPSVCLVCKFIFISKIYVYSTC